MGEQDKGMQRLVRASLGMNERGIALILVISLLTVMSLLATLLMATSTSEIQLSGNYRSSQEAFYAADRAVEYACERLANGHGEVDLYNDTDGSGVRHLERVATERSGLEASDGSDSRNTIGFLGSGPPPVGSGSDVAVFQAHHYAIRVVGISPVNGKNPARCEVRAQVAKIVPN